MRRKYGGAGVTESVATAQGSGAERSLGAKTQLRQFAAAAHLAGRFALELGRCEGHAVIHTGRQTAGY